MSFLNNFVKHSIAYKCLDCKREVRIPLSRQEYKETFKCIACGGRLVDKWMIGKYEHTKKDNNENVPLLQIELDTYGSVPRVFHKGEEITDKVSIDFSWVTNDEWGQYGPYIKIVHCDNKSEYPLQRTIEYEDVSND